MIFDVEADGLLDEATKIHVLAYEADGEIRYTHDYQEMRDILTDATVLIGHNIVCYDIPLLERILSIKIKARLIDTLALSWYLNHNRVRHGLEWYGVDYGIPKPEIDDWEGLTPAEYAHRCIEDVKINRKLWDQLSKKLKLLYGDVKEARRLVRYLTFKMDCLRQQEHDKWKLNKEVTKKALQELYVLRDEKTAVLAAALPKVEKFGEKVKPAKPYKKDGSLSVAGAKWFKLLKDNNLPEDYPFALTVKLGTKEPNPNSVPQVKDWLYSLGWKPASFKYDKDQFGGEKKIPQIRIEGKEGKELCFSVKELIAEYPSVAVLEGLSVINHRISILEGFLKSEKNGYLVAGAAGLTNTLRLKHRVLVNLPGVHKAWGKEIRGSLVADDGWELCGSDMCSLEETTKKHYMYPYDPEFVAEMSKPGFDAHLDLAKHAKVVTQQEIDDYVNDVEGCKNLSLIRKVYKAANYSCIYGVGAAKLARETGMSKKQAQALIDAYWARNWAVRKLSEDTVTKSVEGEMWLFNPVSRFWYSLRNEKDIFSTLNQGTGVYCFDTWIFEFRKVRKQLTAQFHDEVVLMVPKTSTSRPVFVEMLKSAIGRVNKKLKLNVPLDVDIQFGDSYAEIH